MRTSWASRLLRGSVILALLVFAGLPLYWMITTALAPDGTLFTGQPVVPDLTRILDIFAVFDSGVPLLRWLGNSAFVAIGTTTLSLALAILAGYGLSRYRFHGRGVVGLALFTTQMLPEALIIVPLYALFATLGLLNGLAGLVLANTAFAMPVAVWIV
jgi:multiple sugar transport system permease protein